MKDFSSFVLFGDFFKVYEITADETGFDFNYVKPSAMIGGFISIGLTIFLNRFSTIK